MKKSCIKCSKIFKAPIKGPSLCPACQFEIYEENCKRELKEKEKGPEGKKALKNEKNNHGT